MKRKNGIAAVLAMLLLAGCSANTSDIVQEKTVPSSAAVEETLQETENGASAEGKTILPIPSGIDPAHLDQCTVAVSFDKGDAFVDDTGKMQLRVRVYVYDLYDMADISMLQVGDRITICGQDVAVTSLERDEYGAVLINGGMENDGYTLVPSEGTTFYANDFNDMKLYYEVGEATVPVSTEFEFEDSSNLEKGSCTYYPGDFLADDAGIQYHFVPNNTTITIQDGYVVRMQRVYNP